LTKPPAQQAGAVAEPISGEEIRVLRERAHLSQTVFARYLNLTASYVSQLERARNTQPVRPSRSLISSSVKAWRRSFQGSVHRPAWLAVGMVKIPQLTTLTTVGSWNVTGKPSRFVYRMDLYAAELLTHAINKSEGFRHAGVQSPTPYFISTGISLS
jgi:hypothetical protein